MLWIGDCFPNSTDTELEGCADSVVFCCSKLPTEAKYAQWWKKKKTIAFLLDFKSVVFPSVHNFFFKYGEYIVVGTSTLKPHSTKYWCPISRLYRLHNSLHAKTNWWLKILSILKKSAKAFSFCCFFLLFFSSDCYHQHVLMLTSWHFLHQPTLYACTKKMTTYGLKNLDQGVNATCLFLPFFM